MRSLRAASRLRWMVLAFCGVWAICFPKLNALLEGSVVYADLPLSETKQVTSLLFLAPRDNYNIHLIFLAGSHSLDDLKRVVGDWTRKDDEARKGTILPIHWVLVPYYPKGPVRSSTVDTESSCAYSDSEQEVIRCVGTIKNVAAGIYTFSAQIRDVVEPLSSYKAVIVVGHESLGRINYLLNALLTLGYGTWFASWLFLVITGFIVGCTIAATSTVRHESKGIEASMAERPTSRLGRAALYLSGPIVSAVLYLVSTIYNGANKDDGLPLLMFALVCGVGLTVITPTLQFLLLRTSKFRNREYSASFLAVSGVGACCALLIFGLLTALVVATWHYGPY